MLKHRIKEYLKQRPKTISELVAELNYSKDYIQNSVSAFYNQRRYDNRSLYWVKDFRILQKSSYIVASTLSDYGSMTLRELSFMSGVEKRFLSALLRKNDWLFKSEPLSPDGSAGRPQSLCSLKFSPFNSTRKSVSVYIIDSKGREYFNK